MTRTFFILSRRTVLRLMDVESSIIACVTIVQPIYLSLSAILPFSVLRVALDGNILVFIT